MSSDAQKLWQMFDELDRLEDKPREDYIRAPFGWPGGKQESLPYILPKLPVRKVWVETCGGAGWVSLNRQPCDLEVFNDRHAGIIAFYRCVRDAEKCLALRERLELSLHSREEFVWSRDSWQNCSDDVERAARWYYMLRCSFGQLGRNFGRATSGRSQQGRALQNGLELFPLIHSRFRNFQIENLDVTVCIRDYDSPSTVFYVDPDYIGANPGIYSHTVQHRELLDTIRDSQGFFAVSGYANDLYDRQYATLWDDRITWKVSVTLTSQCFKDNNLEGKEGQMRRDQKAEEVLWIREAK